MGARINVSPATPAATEGAESSKDRSRAYGPSPESPATMISVCEASPMQRDGVLVRMTRRNKTVWRLNAGIMRRLIFYHAPLDLLPARRAVLRSKIRRPPLVTPQRRPPALLKQHPGLALHTLCGLT